MSRPMTVSDSVVINISPDVVYAAISDPTQTGRWSPENLGASVTDPTYVDSRVGMIFVGRNRRGRYQWSTRCRVTTAEPGRRFAFDVEAIGRRTPWLTAPISTWTYDLDQVDGGTKVTETWQDLRTRWPDRFAAAFDKVATRSTFAEFNARNIRSSLDKLKQTLESE